MPGISRTRHITACLQDYSSEAAKAFRRYFITDLRQGAGTGLRQRLAYLRSRDLVSQEEFHVFLATLDARS